VTVNANDFTAVNITFQNTTGEGTQAVAILLQADRSAFKYCRILGASNTMGSYISSARQYFKNCYVEGSSNFIWGNQRAVFDSCVVYAKVRTGLSGSGMTSANTKQSEPYGLVFRDCKIPANTGGTNFFL